MKFWHDSAPRRNPYPPQQRERAIEDRLAAYFAGLADTERVRRQVRFPDGSRADLVVEAILPELDDTPRLVTVIEVKADKARLAALHQLNGYMYNMRRLLYEEGRADWMLAGIIAAPSFDPALEDYAACCAYGDTPFSILRVAA